MSAPSAGPDDIGFSTRRIARNTVARVLTAAVGQGAKGLIAILVARELGAAAFGLFSLVWTVTGIAAYYGALGIDNLLTRELARPSPRVDLRRALPLVSGVGVVTAAAVIASAYAFTDGLGPAFVAAAPYVALTAPLLVFAATFNARERMELESVSESIEAATSLAGAVIVLSQGGGIVGVLGALSLGRAIGIIVAIIIHRRLPPLPHAPVVASVRTVVVESLPMGGVRVLNAAYQRADIIILGIVASATDVGLYSAAAIAVILAVDGLSEMGRAAYPAFSRAKGRTDPQLRAAFAIIWRSQMYVAAAGAAGLIALSGPLVRDIFGGEFDAAGPLLAVMAVSLVLRVLGNLAGISLYAVDRQVDRLRSVVMATAAKLLFLAVLVPPFGLWGAVTATIIADVTYIAATLWFVRHFRPRLALTWLPAAATAVCVGVAALLTPGPTVVRVLAGVGTFLVIIRLVAGRNPLTMARNIVTAPAPQHAVQVGPVRLELAGMNDPTNSVIARSLAQLPAATAATTAMLNVVFTDNIETDGIEVYGYPIRRAADAVIAVDHAGRAASLPIRRYRSEPVTIHPQLETDTYQSWIQLPMLRAALHECGWCLARMTVLDVNGKRVAIVARSATGKTRVSLALLQRGAAFVGDDWVALGPDGVATACSLVVLRDQTRASLGRFTGIDRVRSATSRLFAQAARRLSMWRKLSLGLSYAESLLWRWGTEVVDIQSLIAGVEVASRITPITHIAVLDTPETRTDKIDRDALAVTIASRAVVNLPTATTLEAIVRAGWPDVKRLRMPSIDDDVSLIAAALRDAQVKMFHITPAASSVTAVANQIETWCQEST